MDVKTLADSQHKIDEIGSKCDKRIRSIDKQSETKKEFARKQRDTEVCEIREEITRDFNLRLNELRNNGGLSTDPYDLLLLKGISSNGIYDSLNSKLALRQISILHDLQDQLEQFHGQTILFCYRELAHTIDTRVHTIDIREHPAIRQVDKEYGHKYKFYRPEFRWGTVVDEDDVLVVGEKIEKYSYHNPACTIYINTGGKHEHFRFEEKVGKTEVVNSNIEYTCYATDAKYLFGEEADQKIKEIEEGKLLPLSI